MYSAVLCLCHALYSLLFYPCLQTPLTSLQGYAALVPWTLMETTLLHAFGECTPHTHVYMCLPDCILTVVIVGLHHRVQPCVILPTCPMYLHVQQDWCRLQQARQGVPPPSHVRGQGPRARHDQLLRAVCHHPTVPPAERWGHSKRDGATLSVSGGPEEAGRSVRVHPVCVLQHLLPLLLVERRQVLGTRCANAGLPVDGG